MTLNKRMAMVAQAAWAIQHESAIHYAQDRPIPLDRFKAHKLPITTDCSGFVSCLAFSAGVKPDPNGQSYNGQGYTGTLLQHCEHITKHTAKAGDFIAYGPYPGEHVVMLLEDGSLLDPWVVSHGQERGPIRVKASTEAKAHAAPSVYLRSMALVTPSYVWDIRDGRNEVIAMNVKHPALYAMAHRKLFRRKGVVSYHRRSV